jgi:hypothetical protein
MEWQREFFGLEASGRTAHFAPNHLKLLIDLTKT